ncbi:MAG: hypothetical protein H6970_14650 [Gammaproteobacteria bacterium]|nr:hypothetical protein [Gammaproteobacteria bacterium]MCP5458350.1 hypothetical protein [Gammaproteobacteria bacterium]
MPTSDQARKLHRFVGSCLNQALALQQANYAAGAANGSDNRRTQTRFACVACGFGENADGVVAINVLRAGHARLACEVSGAVRPPATGTHRSYLGVAQCRV